MVECGFSFPFVPTKRRSTLRGSVCTFPLLAPLHRVVLEAACALQVPVSRVNQSVDDDGSGCAASSRGLKASSLSASRFM